MRWHDGDVIGAGVAVTDEVHAPIEPSPDLLRDGSFTATARALFGLIRFAQNRFQVGPITLFRFGAPHFQDPDWVFPIEGGLLARRPGGEVRVGWDQERLYSTLDGYQPQLPRVLFRLTQFPFHREISRIALLQVRGRLPSAGLPAEPWRRLVAGLLDAIAATCVAAAARPRTRGGRVLLVGAALLATQTVIPVLTGGFTPGGWVAGTRIVGVDGGRVHLAQLLLRTAALPLGVRTLRDRHDELAGTEVILALRVRRE
jgi:hypothetical protein